jgi:DNA polymerase-3 subunit epsilon
MIITGLDIETTGLDQAKGHRIIEVAALLYDYQGPDSITLKGQWQKRINPQRPIDPGAQAVHHISFDELAMEALWEAVAPTVGKVLKSTNLLITHNGIGFDKPFIDAEMVRIGLSPIQMPMVDTMTEARWATPNGKFPKLAELCFSLGVEYDPTKAHAALYDVQVMMECYFMGIKKGFFPTIQIEEKEIALVS